MAKKNLIRLKNLSLFIGVVASFLLIFKLASCDSNNSSDTNGANNVTADSIQSQTAAANDSIKNEPDTTADGRKKDVIRVTSENTQDLINYMNSSPDHDKYASGILHRMAQDSPEYTKKIINTGYDRFIIVDKQAMELGVFDRFGREQFRCGIACAKNFGTKVKKGDSRTVEGFFSAQGIYDSTNWKYTNDRGYTSPARGVYGPRFIRVKNPTTNAIGIHGTSSPGSIGHRVSHGCIRVQNQNILEIVKLAEVGMPIIISPSDRDMAVNEKEGRYIAQVTINPNSAHTAEASVYGNSKSSSSYSSSTSTTVKKDNTSKVSNASSNKENNNSSKPAQESNSVKAKDNSKPAAESAEPATPAKEAAPEKKCEPAAPAPAPAPASPEPAPASAPETV